MDAFITLHTYSQIWIHPYGHKKDSYPADIKDLVILKIENFNFSLFKFQIVERLDKISVLKP